MGSPYFAQSCLDHDPLPISNGGRCATKPSLLIDLHISLTFLLGLASNAVLLICSWDYRNQPPYLANVSFLLQSIPVFKLAVALNYRIIFNKNNKDNEDSLNIIYNLLKCARIKIYLFHS
jgi:hypothetical protein